MKKMKMFALTAVCALILCLSACGSTAQENDNQIQSTTETSEISRQAHFQINAEVQQFIQPDNDYVKLIDDLYVAATSSFQELSFDDSIYDAAVTLSEKVNESFTDLLSENNEEFKKWYISYACSGTFGLSEIIIAGYEEAVGAISEKTAFCKMVQSVDSVLNFYYKDYQPIFELPTYTASEILTDYDNNEIAANNTYNGKLICVKGYIKEITKDVFDHYYISIGDGSKYGDELRCYFDNTHKPEFVMLHFTSAVVLSPDDPYDKALVRGIFEDYEVSVHYIIDRDGEVRCYVPEELVAYHAGRGTWGNDPQYTDSMNEYAIGIEIMAIGSEMDMEQYLTADAYRKLDPEHVGFTDAQYEALNALVRDICSRNAILLDRQHVIGHEDYSPAKADPGELFDWERLELQ